MDKIESRVLGGILGLVVGDALGAPLEMASSNFILEHFGVVNEYLDVYHRMGKLIPNWQKGKWTDDSALMLIVLKSINTEGCINPITIAKEFQNLYEQGDFHRFLGGTTKRAMECLKQGISWEKSGEIAMKSPLQGAGSLMRTLPVGIFNLKNETKNINDSTNISKITHASPLSVNACIVYDQIISEIINTNANYRSFRNIIKKYMSLPSIIPEIQQIMKNAMNNQKQDEKMYRDQKHNVLIIFETAIWILLTTHSYFEAMVTAINLGGDTDTTAAVTGGLAGTLYGIEHIPQAWLEPIEQKELFIEQAKLLYNAIK